MIRYVSTRGGEAGVSAERAIVQGLARDGGLFVPESMPEKLDPESLRGMSYQRMAERIVGLFFDGFEPDDVGACVRAAYGAGFDDERVVPVSACGELWLTELWHGPTSAFKDMALTVLPRLLTLSRRALGEQGTTAILTATSGDTGKAALAGFKDVPGTDLTVFFPLDGVSRVQKLQMLTSPGENVEVVAVEGNFDDCQRLVKAASAAPEVLAACRGVTISSANSINIGRLVPQVVYYYSTYVRLAEEGALRPGERLNFAVPTGNFGDILAGYLARALGLPVGKLICASNSNNVLTDFIRTGVYDRNRPFFRTMSPSMDILVSSNLERLLYLVGGDAAEVTHLMGDLAERGRYEVPRAWFDGIQSLFYAVWADEAACRGEIRRAFEEEGVLADPHTAVGLCAARQYRRETGDGAPMAVLSTASPFKFPRAVLSCLTDEAPADEFACMDALTRMAGRPAPAQLRGLEGMKPRFDRRVTPAEGIDFVADKMARLSGK